MPALLHYRTKLPKPDDPAIYTPIIEAITKGHPQTTAAALAGIHEDTLFHWRYQGQADLASYDGWMPWTELSAHARLVIRIKEAEAELVDFALTRWREGGKDWTAWCTLLERRQREHFGRNVTVESTSTNVIAVVQLPAGVGDAIIARYAERHGAALANATGGTPALLPPPTTPDTSDDA